MKKFTLKFLASLTIVLWSIMPIKAQSDYGSDIIVKNTPTEDQRHPSLAIAPNGWLYASFTAVNGYYVFKSTDNGQNWSLFTNYSSSATYDVVKILACGTAPYKVFVAVLRHSSATSYEIYIDEYNGTTGAFITEPIWWTFNTDIYDIDIATDDLFPSSLSSPYSVGLLYAVHSGTDSVTFALSTNGGDSFGPKKSVTTTGQWFGKVSLAYGRSWNYSNGRYFAVWEHKEGFNSPVGHVEFSHTNTTVDGSFTPPVYLDNSSNGFLNHCRNPKIACQYNNTDNDSTNLTALVIFERFYSNLDNDVIGVYNKKAANGSIWNTFYVDNSGSTNCKQPDINFDCDYNNFLVTYWDSTDTYLPYVVQGMNMPTPDTWTFITSNYNDNTTMGSLLQPYPVVEINHALHQVAHLWSREGAASNGVVMFDAEYSTVGIKETIAYGNDKISNLYPNPAFGMTNLEFELNKATLVQINVFDISGKKICNIYNAQTNEGKKTISFDVSNFANGNYLIEMTTEGSKLTTMMTVAHP